MGAGMPASRHADPHCLAFAQATRQSCAEQHQILCHVRGLELSKERSWLARMTAAINQHSNKQNARKKVALPLACRKASSVHDNRVLSRPVFNEGGVVLFSVSPVCGG